MSELSEMMNDPLAAIHAASLKLSLEDKAAGLISSARAQLVLERRRDKERFNSQDTERKATCCFFATVALRLHFKADWTIPTAATDGRHLLYNPEFFSGLNPSEAIGVVCHEVLHVVCKHHCRIGTRQMRRANIAADLAINPIVIGCGFELPKGALFPGKMSEGDCLSPEMKQAIAGFPPGLSFEEYYAKLPDEPEGEGGGDGEGGVEGLQGPSDPGGCGGLKKPGDGSEAATKQAEHEADVTSKQAEQAAKVKGTMPATIAKMVTEALKPNVDWRQQLRDFVSKLAKNDYSWSHPNRRYIAQGLYLPGLRSEEIGDMVVAVDTSGSIYCDPTLLNRFAGEIQGILDAYAVKLTVVYHDSAITGVKHWSSSDGPLQLEPVGGGGTSHVPVFEWVAAQAEQPALMVCLTDMMSAFPECPPEYPVLWARVGDYGTAPFGQLIDVE